MDCTLSASFHGKKKQKNICVLVILVLKQLTVPTGESVARLTEQLQWLLLVDVAKHGPLCGNT